jgi:hypothetical protein
MRKLPGTPEEAIDALTSVGKLIFAKKWERAAIIYALTHGEHRGRPLKAGKTAGNSSISCAELAAQGIVGLTNPHTVARYHDAWQAAVDAGEAQPIKLGDPYTAPGLMWPPDLTHPRLDDGGRRAAIEAQAEADGTGKASALRIAESPQAMAAAIKADAKLADVAAEALAARSRARLAHLNQEPRKTGPQATLWHAMTDLMAMKRKAGDLIRGLQAGDVTLSDDEREMARETIHSVRAALDLAESLVEHGGVSDESLAAWLSGGQS